MKWTIRRKFLIGFMILFSFSALVFNELLAKTIENNTANFIKNELTKQQYTSKEYIKQFSELHKGDDDLFVKYGSTIAQVLSKMHAQSVALYKTDGAFLYEAVPIDKPLLMENQKYEHDVNKTSSTELQQAFQNKAAYTPKKLEKGTIIYFAYPVYIQDKFYGVVRFTGDYSELFDHNQKLLNSFKLLTIFLFIGVFIISLLLTNQIIKPLRYLTIAAKRMASGDYNEISNQKTSDEIGELSSQFQHMQNEIRLHIEKIQEEKEKVLLLEQKRTNFFNNVTHELKTPLATISGYAQIIGDQDFNDAIFLQKAASKIHSESERLNEMVTQLLSFSKSQVSGICKDMEVFDLLPLIQSICEDMELKARKYAMAIEIKGKSYFVKAYRDDMRQVIINVIDNAIKHGKANRSIRILVDEKIIISNDCDQIPSQILEQAFEPFIHEHRKDSHGLGLFICKQILEQYDGAISLHYENNEARIEISFPLWQQVGNNSSQVSNRPGL
ncbi:HAMP domain-containing sensor histidine kinase [Bacillus sp. S/N-304-OC-R1]|uniref:HAMP domain-containing sensor histidine kinase n=1 Tax=Bacillus sp. S/N-304-OC-R1 TaxID=2758034 RepID=UPI001C8E3E59|nr:HAMP domain-containing sensor histidine kinase [Bacillus sp. S/N-304-OC-R1]MBY0122787.1 HAMP domain-containing histidine kinase [Bacillus sp. S/N-304-OC-R1]